jgi:RNA polymerase subunit RPABC4/transcription elongation factor Spt4
MALINCHECETPISNTAKACPHCGAKKPKVRWRENLLAVVIIVFVLIWAIEWGWLS